MRIRSFVDSDLPTLVELTIETFGPFYEGYVREVMGEAVFAHQHGHWAQDYRDDVPTLYNPAAGKHVAVAEVDDSIAGYVAWRPGERPRSGEIYLLAVRASQRRQHVGRDLCEYAIAAMKADGAEVVSIGTGGDDFHAPARAFYESLGCVKLPVAVYFREL